MKKRGINSLGNLPEELKEILSSDEFILSEDGSQSNELIFDATDSEDKNLFFEETDWTKVKRSPIAFLDEEVLSKDIPSMIAKRFFLGEGAVDPQSSFQGTILVNSTLKVTDELSIGQTADMISCFALENKINPVNVRSYIVSILSYLQYLRKADLVNFPIDLDFGVSNDCFYLQLNCPAQNIFIENLVESAKLSSKSNPYSSLIAEASHKTDLLEVYTLAKTKKLVVTACWITEIGEDLSKNRSCLLIHQVNSFSERRVQVENKFKTAVFNKDVSDLGKESTINEKGATNYEEGEANSSQKLNLAIVKKVLDYLLNLHGKDNDFSNYNLSQLESDIENYPDPQMLDLLSFEEKDEVLRIITGKSNPNDLIEKVQLVKAQIEPDEYLDNLISSIDSMSLEQAQIISGGLEEEEHKQVVKGSGDEEEEVSVTIKGVTDVLDEGAWKVKRSNAVEQIRGKFNDLRNSSDLSNEAIKSELFQIISNELNLSDSVGRQIVDSIGDDIADKHLRGASVDSNKEIRQEVEISKMEKKLHMRAQQVDKMKSLISNLSNEVKTLKAAKDESTSEAFHILNKEFVEDHEDSIESESRAIDIEHARELEKIGNEKEKLAKENEVLLRKFKENLAESAVDEEDAGALKEENERLNGQVENLKKKISFMYENSKASKDVTVSVQEVQKIVEDKERYFSEKMKFKKELEDFKVDYKVLENKVKTMEVSATKLPKPSSVTDNQDYKTEAMAKEKELEGIRVRMNKLQAESKSHELKAKSFEQKVKFLNAQLEKFQKEEGRNKMKRSSTSSAVDGKIAERLKQMEAVRRKLKLGNEKLSKELAEKKTVAHKATLESKTMALKIKDLEKKLAIINKKRAA